MGVTVAFLVVHLLEAHPSNYPGLADEKANINTLLNARGLLNCSFKSIVDLQ